MSTEQEVRAAVHGAAQEFAHGAIEAIRDELALLKADVLANIIEMKRERDELLEANRLARLIISKCHRGICIEPGCDEKALEPPERKPEWPRLYCVRHHGFIR